MSDGRSVLVLDADGVVLGSFPEWERAHEWAHLRATGGGATLPVRVEDLEARRTLDVHRERCHLTHWRPMAQAQECYRPG